MSVPCPLCGAPSAPAFATCDLNRHLTEAEFRYRRCSGCGVVFLENVPTDLGRYYDADYHRVPTPSGLDEWAAYEAYKLSLVRPFVVSGRLTDVGASYGAFAYQAKRAGFDVTVVEIDPEACQFIERVVGVQAVQCSAPEEALESLPSSDVITLWHSIEHLAQPWRTVEAAANLLRPGGILVVSSPNPDSLQARWLKGRWAHVDAPRHLFLIPPRALVDRAESCGLVLRLMTGKDIETRRCNRMGWQRGLEELGLRVRGVWWLGAALAAGLGPFERRVGRASAYTAILQKPAP